MNLESIAASIQSTSFSDALKDHAWVVPFLQSIHILMIGVVFVSIVVVSLRVLGRMRADEPLDRVWSRFAPFLWTGLVIMAITGGLLTIAEPVREFMTLSYRLKMGLLVVCITSAAIFGRSVRAAARSGAPGPSATGTRVAAVATMVLWLAIIFLGRAIAYDNTVWGEWSPVESLGGAAL